METGADEPTPSWDWVEEPQEWVPPPIDTRRPNAARMYDYVLGGKDNYPVDREAAKQIVRAVPQARTLAQANRAFLVRAVRQLAEAGITQFLDLGTGIPTSPSVHEMARQVHPDARVVYVDNDPVVMVHSRALLATRPGVVAVEHDLRTPSLVLDDPLVAEVIDFDRPVGLLMVAVLHFVDPGVAPVAVHQYTRRLVPGSYLVASMATTVGVDRAVAAHLEGVYRQSPSPLYLRSRAQIEELFDGFTLLGQGLTEVTAWALEPEPVVCGVLAGIGRKPEGTA